MRVIVQRVTHASCTVDNKITGKIENGYMLLVGLKEGDTIKDLEKMVRKISNLRIFCDEAGKINLNIHQVNGSILSISQFTLYADLKGNRPGFSEAMNPTLAKEYYLLFNEMLRKENLVVEEGIFGADMKIELLNDGPITIILDSEKI